MSTSFGGCIDCPPSMSAVFFGFFIGAALLAIGMAIGRRRNSNASAGFASLFFFLGALWNMAIALAFIYPSNHHVVYLASHEASLWANAAVGVAWLAICLFVTAVWFRRTRAV